jgi:PAS domain S-box-containing protein
VGVVGVGQDITEMDAIRVEMDRTATELTQLIDTANAPIFGVDVDGNINEWNQMVARITGYGKKEVEGKNLVETYITDEYKVSVKKVLDNALGGKEIDNYEVPLYTRNGQRIMVLLNATTRRDVEGNIVGVVGVGQDITELNEYRENLEELVRTRTYELNQSLRDIENARDRIDGILKSVADGLIVTDTYNRIVLMNMAAEDLLGARLSDIIGRPIDFAIDDQTLRDKIKDTLSKKTSGYQLDFELQDGASNHPKIMRARTSIIHGKDGSESGIVTIIHDVTQEREVDRMKTEFLTTAAHELRTPLTAILGFSELLLSSDTLGLEEEKEFIEYIHEESVGVTKIINELLDIGRIEARKEIPLNMEWCIAGDAIRQMISFFRRTCPNHRFEIGLPEEQHRLFVDKDKMVQVIKNIIDNAVKYSPNGGVIRIVGDLGGDNYQITIQDQGVGMDSDQVKQIFDRFYRSSVSLASDIRGIGLGMHIVKSIIDGHKGNIWVESEPGKGTTVSFTIPMNTNEAVVHQN